MKASHCRLVAPLSVAAVMLVQAGGAGVVRTGAIIEAKYGAESAEVMTAEGLGSTYLLFVGPWTGKKIRAVGEHCRRHGGTFSMDEMFNRLTGNWKPQYASIKDEVLAALREYRDVLGPTQHYSETGGVLSYWPPSSSHSARVPTVSNSYSSAFEATCRQVEADYSHGVKSGLPTPLFSIECSFAFAPYLLKAGWERVDLEVIYSDEIERSYAGVKTAAEVFGRKGFGADMAVAWYGGATRDGLWESRWRTSLYHAYLRGADPIYVEHGLMDYNCLGHSDGRDAPDVKRLRRVFGEFAKWVRDHPRADGLPLAAVAAVYGRHDGYTGVFQTHLFGQRTNELFRIDDADLAWRLFDGLYRRRAWQGRDLAGEVDYSGNPPLGAADILPYDAPDPAFAKHKALFFLGRNRMDDALYAKLIRYVKGGGTLLLAASHLDVQDVPKAPFLPYNGGDWTALCGVRMDTTVRPMRLRLGIRFTANPDSNWAFQPLTNDWDPMFTDGGFDVPALKATTATTCAVASDRFTEKDLAACEPILYVNRLGRGKVILLASLDPPGSREVRRLYSFLLDKCLEAEGRGLWPKVECADTVRWSVYPDGTIYLLNTEANLTQEAIVTSSADGPSDRIILPPGGILEFNKQNTRTKRR